MNFYSSADATDNDRRIHEQEKDRARRDKRLELQGTSSVHEDSLAGVKEIPEVFTMVVSARRPDIVREYLSVLRSEIKISPIMHPVEYNCDDGRALMDRPFRLICNETELDDGQSFYFRQTFIIPPRLRLCAQPTIDLVCEDALCNESITTTIGSLDTYLNKKRLIFLCSKPHLVVGTSDAERYRQSLPPVTRRNSFALPAQESSKQELMNLTPLYKMFDKREVSEWYRETLMGRALSQDDGLKCAYLDQGHDKMVMARPLDVGIAYVR